MKLLIVDNNQRMRAAIRKIVNQYINNIETIQECGNGEDAIKLYRQNRADYVLMDIELNELDGLSVAREILKFDPAAKIIILTQYGENSYREAALASGIFGFIVKDNLLKILELIK